MANPEHLQILKQGVEAWNKWRREDKNLLILPDLSRADLFGADLHHITLSRSDLSGATLNVANLDSADLFGAKLSHANLTAANLHNAYLVSATCNSAKMNLAHLSDADLRAASFINADFTGADLFATSFYSTTLTGADFKDTRLMLTKFSEMDLSEVKNLEFARHGGPSSISLDTIYKSGGNIPERFLRGCGVPEDFITYMRSLVGKPIEFYSCFISYSSKDEEFTKRLYNDLQSEGVRCWFAPEDLRIGEKFRVRIDEAVRLHDKLLLVLSENSVSSQWVEKEVETAFEKEAEQGKTVLFPVQLDDAVSEIKMGWAADIRRTRHTGDFRDWKNHDSYKKAFERLMRDLKAGEKR